MSQGWVFHLQPHRCWSVLAFGKAELKRWVVHWVLHVGKFSFGVLPEGAAFKGSEFLWERECLLQLKLRRAHKTVSTQLTFSGKQQWACTSQTEMHVIFILLTKPVLPNSHFCGLIVTHHVNEKSQTFPVISTGLSGSFGLSYSFQGCICCHWAVQGTCCDIRVEYFSCGIFAAAAFPEHCDLFGDIVLYYI